MHQDFKSRVKCLKYAQDFLKEHGSGWKIFKNYHGMTSERIAAEIWFHAVVFYIGVPILALLLVLNINIAAFWDIVKASNPITVNSKDDREAWFWIVWLMFPYLEFLMNYNTKSFLPIPRVIPFRKL